MTRCHHAIVGIGASAGGVEALRSFFAVTQPDCALTFVVYLHFPAQATSHLVEILTQSTRLPVSAAVDGEALQPDHVYIVPPGKRAVFAAGGISLSALNESHYPIDALFGSLASEYGERAIGVILSGTGRDGARGMEAISARGGLTVAQGDGGNSSHPEMPASAIATGLVDYVMRVEEMPAHLAAYGKGLSSGGRGTAVEVAPHRLKDIKDELCGLLRQTAKHDFSRYKASTFLRRVGRRMRVLGIADWDAYVERARRNPDEVTLLFRDLLIGVTAFFRDVDAFDVLATRIIPRLFKDKGPRDVVRVWVPGCSSGEEAYSIAILLLEYAQTISSPPQLQVFATDVDEAALRIARAGTYSAAAMGAMRQDRVADFFTCTDDKFIAARELRTICTFSLHSLIRDPPLCFIDLISCRNVLIYFDRNLQDQVIPTFHFALRPGGILFLGPSENVGRLTDLFIPVDNANRIFEQVASSRRSIPFLPPSKTKALVRPDVPARRTVVAERTVAQLAEAQILKRYGPANVVVNNRGDVVHFSPRTGKYLEPISGSPSHNLLAMARKGLRVSLRSALHEAKKSGHIAVHDNVAVELDVGVVQRVRVAVEPLDQGGEGLLWLVTFADIGPIAMGEAGPKDDRSMEADLAIQLLERELQDTREHLQTATDEYEIAVEELRSSNEELMSMNDDLQASNEELEASKEELHVVNDELRTVNADLAAKIEELKQANGDLRNIFENTKIAVIFLDKNLVIRSFTRTATEMFRLVPNDNGRLLTDIVSYVECDTLNADMVAALQTHETVERAIIRRDGGAHYLLRVIPYLTLGGEVDGVLVTLVNVTAAVEAQAQERYHRLLIAELNHRVKNILTVAASLATQSLRNTTTAADFASVFLGRLQALSKAHDLLSNENWSEVPLRALVLTALELQAEDKERVTISGPAIRLDAKVATTLSLAFHELATNATKYGAFSNDKGHIHIAWAQEVRPDGTMLVIRWRETGGPPVQPPSRKGFGSEMIERGIKYELRGQAKMAFLPAGLEVEISMPLEGQPSSGPKMRAPHESSE
jgi:two-component system CheB/CheR fusion protein